MQSDLSSGPPVLKAPRSRRLRSKPVQRFLRNRLALLGATVFVLIVVTAILAPVLTQYSPIQAAFGAANALMSLAFLAGVIAEVGLA